MSHGGEESIEPDLVPLLDLVMQLLMFFIINLNFVSREMDAGVKLPTSTSARPEQLDANALFLNLRRVSDAFKNTLTEKEKDRLRNQPVCVTVLGELPRSQLEARGWLSDKYKAMKSLPGGTDKDGEVKTIIHIRPEADLEVKDLFMLMQSVKASGFKKIKIHAVLKSGGGA
jgi:biopolymer transport protein ExbD